jgi:RHS repeat-associated protein
VKRTGLFGVLRRNQAIGETRVWGKICASRRLAIVAALQVRVAAKENAHLYDGGASGASYYNYFRDFDPLIGRYIESDPLGLAAGLDTYTYVEGAPLSFSDPDGLDRWGDQPGFGWEMKPGVPLPKPEIYAHAVCLHQCLGQPFVITSTHEPTPQHPPGTPHASGQAFDIRFPNQPDKALCCAKKCGAGFGLNEYRSPSPRATGGHVHIQIPPGRRGGSGDLPRQGCNPCDTSAQCCP